jgi:hypothetical protein
MLMSAGWTTLAATAWAAATERDVPAGKESGSWTLSYALVLFCVILGLLVVLRGSNRRARAKPEQYAEKNLLNDD